MNAIARIISAIFSPLLIPTYAIILALTATYMFVLPLSTKLTVGFAVLLTTCIIPLLAIFILYKMKIVSDTGLNHQSERAIPYIITVVCYLMCAFYFYRAHAPGWLTMFMVGGSVAAVISLVVNRWWKISAHGAAIGGLTAMMFRILVLGVGLPSVFPLTLFTILAAGLVGSSRVLLERHTLPQVLCGTANGFICVYLASLI